MDKNLDKTNGSFAKIVENLRYHTSLVEPPKYNILDHYKKKQPLSLRQIDMLNYHTEIILPSLEEKIISAYNNNK